MIFLFKNILNIFTYTQVWKNQSRKPQKVNPAKGRKRLPHVSESDTTSETDLESKSSSQTGSESKDTPEQENM